MKSEGVLTSYCFGIRDTGILASNLRESRQEVPGAVEPGEVLGQGARYVDTKFLMSESQLNFPHQVNVAV